jgi:hypothetical protein
MMALANYQKNAKTATANVFAKWTPVAFAVAKGLVPI